MPTAMQLPLNGARMAWPVATCLAIALSGSLSPTVSAQENEATAPAAADEDLSEIQARLADRYDRLELLVGRLAELSRSAQPQRAELLQQMIARSRQRNVPGKFDEIVAALEKESFSSAVEGQTQLEGELQGLLELLLQEDRERQLESERKRIMRYLQDVNRLIRLQRGVKARTDGGDDAEALAKDQQRVGDDTEKLGKEIEETEAANRESADEPPAGEGEPSEGDGEPSQGSGEQGAQSADEGDGRQEESEKPNADREASDPGDDPPAEEKEQADGESPSPSDEPAAESDPSKATAEPPGGESAPQDENKPSEGSPNDSEGQGQSPSPSGGPPSEQPSDESPPQEPNSMQRAAERLQQARQRMEEAQKRLEESKRDGALEQQEKAVEELEQARAEFERILRQLREEELERMLVLLEARFRKMLDEQIEIHEETQRLEAAASKAAAHELEIASGRLARREDAIVREADRALILLREDGTSTAFPEAIEQARDDMQAISERLRDVKLDLITQGLEEDVIAALEEALATLQASLDELREQRSDQQDPSQGGGEPGEQPLVDDLQELRMIRALQLRVNTRTQRYGAMIDGEQASDADLLEALRELSIRQQKIFNATRDLGRKEN